MPFVPSSAMWAGYSLTNPHDTAVQNVTFTTYTAAGDPVQTLLGPVTFAPGEKRLFLFSNYSKKSK